MYPELGAREPLGGVAVQADHVLPRHMGGEGEAALAAVHLAHDYLVVRIPDLHVHPNLWAGGRKPIGAGVVELRLVVGRHLCHEFSISNLNVPPLIG